MNSSPDTRSELETLAPASGDKWLMRLSAIVMAAGVALGAYGAHGLEADAKGLANWKTAVLYHLIHGIALYMIASRASHGTGAPKCCRNGAWWCLFVGVLIFSGMLYAIVLTGVTWLGAIVPIGGLAMILGWLWLAAAPK